MKTVFVTDRSERHQQIALADAPEMLDITMLCNPNSATLKAQLVDAVVFISERHGIIDADLLDVAANLKLILRLGSQTHDIDLQAAAAHHITVAYDPIPSVMRVAEHAIMQILALVKRLCETQTIAMNTSNHWGASARTDENTFAYNWSQRDNIGSLFGKCIGLLGFGEIGFEITRRLQHWGCDLLYNKRQRLPESIEQQWRLVYRDSASLLAESDILLNLLPYSTATDMFIDAERLSTMKKEAYLVSVGSGSTIDEAALAAAIQRGQLAGAALDTYEYEPLLANNPLLPLAAQGYNIILTPHIAAGTADYQQERQAQYANIIRYLNHDPLKNRLV